METAPGTRPLQDDRPAGDTARPAGRPGPSALTDDELLRRAATGDEGAFRLLVERWERPVFGFLYRMTGSAEEALDLRQETFLRVHAQAARYDARGQFRSWLFRIAGNLARSALRRRRILSWVRFDGVRHDRPAPGTPPDEQLDRDALALRVRAAVARLPQRQRAAVALRQDQGLSYREIAAALDTSESAVESLLIRAAAALRRHLAAEKEAS